MKPVRIITIDDHKMIREMWANLFEDDPNFLLVGESGGLDEGIALIKRMQPDIILLDINLGADSGIDAMPSIRELAPRSHVIAVSMHNQPMVAKKMIQAGARGYVTKNSAFAEIFTAIKVVMGGAVYICAEVKNILTMEMVDKKAQKQGIDLLTKREMEIVALIRDGLSSVEIARLINLSKRTVEVHRHNILKKLKMKNTASMVNYIKNVHPDI